MLYDGEIVASRTKAVARCLIADCGERFEWSAEKARNAVIGARTELRKHRNRVHKNLGHKARVNVVLANGVEA